MRCKETCIPHDNAEEIGESKPDFSDSEAGQAYVHELAKRMHYLQRHEVNTLTNSQKNNKKKRALRSISAMNSSKCWERFSETLDTKLSGGLSLIDSSNLYILSTSFLSESSDSLNCKTRYL